MLTPKILSTVTSILALLFQGTLYACESGWFGFNCEFKCQCQGTCKLDGSCQSGSTCITGQFGPACQYRDMSYLYGEALPHWLTDGNSSTCQTDANAAVIVISFNITFPFIWLRLTVKEDCDRNKFHVVFNNKQLCRNEKKYIFDKNVHDVTCEKPIMVNKISVTGQSVRALCDLQVSGGRNVALRQPTNQTSDFHHPDFASVNFPSHLAVDGNKPSDFRDVSCSITDPASLIKGSWSLFYRRHQFLYSIDIYSRKSAKYNLTDFTLATYSRNSTLIQLYTGQRRTENIYSVVITSSSEISWLQITTRSMEQVLELCEVETYGDTGCLEGKWGLDCSHSCDCKMREHCFFITGNCSSVCPAGYYGPKCSAICPGVCDNNGCHVDSGLCYKCKDGYGGDTCDIICPVGTYGYNCSMICSKDCQGDNCIYEGGTSSCQNGLYGPLCSFSCPENCFEHKCHAIYGICFSCKPGFYGNYCNISSDMRDCLNESCDCRNGHCKEVCPNGTYGKDCSLPCPSHCQGGICSRENGKCISCQEGFYGEFCFPCAENCDNETCNHTRGACFFCKNGFFGTYCSATCPEKCNGRTCHKTSGVCFSCVAGYYGKLCNYPCKKKCLMNKCNFLSGICSLEASTLGEKSIQNAAIYIPVALLILVTIALTVFTLVKKYTISFSQRNVM